MNSYYQVISEIIFIEMNYQYKHCIVYPCFKRGFTPEGVDLAVKLWGIHVVKLKRSKPYHVIMY